MYPKTEESGEDVKRTGSRELEATVGGYFLSLKAPTSDRLNASVSQIRALIEILTRPGQMPKEVGLPEYVKLAAAELATRSVEFHEKLLSEMKEQLFELLRMRGVTSPSRISGKIYTNAHGICGTLTLLWLMFVTFLQPGDVPEEGALGVIDPEQRRRRKIRFFQLLRDFEEQLQRSPIREAETELARRSLQMLVARIPEAERASIKSFGASSLFHPDPLPSQRLVHLFQISKTTAVMTFAALDKFVEVMVSIVNHMRSQDFQKLSFLMEIYRGPNIQGHIMGLSLRFVAGSRLLKMAFYDPDRGGHGTLYSALAEITARAASTQELEFNIRKFLVAPFKKDRFVSCAIFGIDSHTTHAPRQLSHINITYIPSRWSADDKCTFIFVAFRALAEHTNSSTPGIKESILALIVQSPDVLWKRFGSDNDTLLLLATRFGHAVLVETVAARLGLKRAEVMNMSASNGATSLYIAAGEGYQEVVAILIAAGAIVDFANGETPLFIAAKNGYEGIVEMLLAAGAAVDLPRSDGVTPLAVARENGREGVIRILLAAGAAK